MIFVAREILRKSYNIIDVATANLDLETEKIFEDSVGRDLVIVV